MTNKIEDPEEWWRGTRVGSLAQVKALAARQELLRLALIRVSLHLQGQDASLDSLLKLLRESLQDSAHGDINSLIARFDEAEPHIKQRREENIQAIRDSLLGIIQPLQQLSLSRTIKKAINIFLSDLSHTSKKAYYYAELLQQLAKIQQQVVSEINQPKMSFWEKLITKQSENAEQTVTDELVKCLKYVESSLESAVDFIQLKTQIKLHLDNLEQTLPAQDAVINAKKSPPVLAQLQKVLHDPLTGLPNREYYRERLTHEYHRWKRYSRPLTIAIFDIDTIHNIDNEYGQEAGDKILRIIGSSIAKRLREVDFFARLENTRFVALLPETKLEGARLVLEKIRTAIANTSFNYQAQVIPITLSISATDFKDGDAIESAFLRADTLLSSVNADDVNCLRFI